MSRSGEDAFLQARVARFGLFIGLISLAGFLVRSALHLALGNAPSTFLSSAWGAHLLAAVLLLGLFALLRGRPRRRRTVAALEVAGIFGAAVCYEVVGLHLLPEARSDYVLLLTLNVMFVGRAAFVPSSPTRTLWLTALAGVPLLALIYLDLRLGTPDPSMPPHAAETRTLNAAVWWTFITMLSVLITRTIYGLRREVRQARRLGQYQLEELLAVGGMGEVYRARHAMLRRPTAVKLIRPERVGERALARFEREAKLTAGLSHPHTVTVYDYGRTEEGVFYYAMELLEGADLQTVVELTGPLPPGRACRILAQVAGALAEAHAAGLIHRDVKPGNILLVERGGDADTAKVVDFGLVKDAAEDDLGLSEDGRILGTPLYVSPEAIADPDAVDERSDLYALGAVAYFLLTGRPPFRGKTPLDVYRQHLESLPPPLDTAEPLDPTFERVILECLEKAPRFRPQSAREVEIRLLDAAERLEPWDAYDAKRWWAEHGPALRARQPHTSVSGDPRVTVLRSE
jgi:serine/threonine-protein kinase